MPDPYHADRRARVEVRVDTAAGHHGVTFDDVGPARVASSVGPMAVWVLELGADALVTGSRQRLDAEEAARAARLGLEVTGRRSGGGAVYLSAATSLWVDLWFPTVGDTPVDLAELFVVVGRAWDDGLQSLGLVTSRHDGPPSADPAIKALARRVCFADVGWGEVCVGSVKVVGLSQRRVRQGARVQCVVELTGNGARVADVVTLTDAERAVVRARTEAVSDRSARAVQATLLDAITAL